MSTGVNSVEMCYFDSGIYASLGGSYLPGDQNSNEDGSARDVLGREVKYRCMEEDKTLIEEFMVLKNDPDFEEHVCF